MFDINANSSAGSLLVFTQRKMFARQTLNDHILKPKNLVLLQYYPLWHPFSTLIYTKCEEKNDHVLKKKKYI